MTEIAARLISCSTMVKKSFRWKSKRKKTSKLKV